MVFLPDDPLLAHSRTQSRSLLREDFPRNFVDHPQFHHHQPFPPIKHTNVSLYPPTALYPVDDDSMSPAILHDSFPLPLQNGHPLPVSSPSQPPRWSSSYSTSLSRSRSSSIGNSYHDVSPPPLSQKPSYDLSWQTVDEKDEIAISEEETDDEQTLDNLDDDSDPKDDPEPTSAAIVAEQGRGLIVDAESYPIFQLQIQPGPFPRCTSLSILYTSSFFQVQPIY